MFTCLATPAQAATDGRNMVFVAKGTLYDPNGNAFASNVWFSFTAFVYSYQVKLGMNQVGSASLQYMTTYGSGGSIFDMSGPVLEYANSQYASFFVTEIYCFAQSVSSCTVIGDPTPIMENVGHAGLGHLLGGAPAIKMTGPNAASPDWVGLTGAILVALALIGGLLVLDRKRSGR
jgi:hypothetical protein